MGTAAPEDGSGGRRRFPITVCMLTLNEEDRLPRSLPPLRDRVARIVVLDADSDDATREVAAELGAEVFVRPWEGYVAARRHLLSLAETEWVLMLDADEVVEEGLWEELARRGFPAGSADGYRMRRRTVYLGRRLRRAWQPDWKTVLFRRAAARIPERAVHESVQVAGRTGRLRSEILHLSYRSVAEHYDRMLRYAVLAAGDLERQGRRAGWWDLALRPAWSWFSHFVLRGAFVDGKLGWMAAKSSAVSVFLRYALLYGRQRAREAGGAAQEAEEALPGRGQGRAGEAGGGLPDRTEEDGAGE